LVGLLEIAGGEGEVGAAPEAFEAEAEVVGGDGEALMLTALELAQQAEEFAGAGGREAAEALVPEEEEAGGGGDLLDDGVEGFLLGGVGDVLEAVVEGEAALPAGEAAVGDDAAAELLTEGVAQGEGVGALDEFGFGVEGGDRVVVGAEGFAGAVEGDEGAQTRFLFEIGEGDGVDVFVGEAWRAVAEVGAEGWAARQRGHGEEIRTFVLFGQWSID